jgi:glucose/arabinose dehydrogenase
MAQTINEGGFEVRTWVDGLDSPTGIAFTGNKDEAFIIQKEDGQVKLMRGREIVDTVLDLRVANASEQGLLGIALHPSYERNKLVYLYRTAASEDGGQATANRIDRYRFDEDKNELVFDRAIRRLTAVPGPNHDGGKLMFGPDRKLYAVIGDVNRDGQTQNYEDSNSLSLTGAILRLNASGTAPTDNPFYDKDNIGARRPLNDIYAYGVRNSFGIAFDPVSDTLWDTENGSGDFDEINRVRAGFNSGWEDIMGPTGRNGGDTGELVELGPKAHYANPRFSWLETVAPTDLHFNTSTRLGPELRNDLFVGDVNTGALYHFDLTGNRKSLDLDGPLADKVADNDGDLHDEQDDILFGEDFGVITDLVTGPGGMFVLTLDGALYRIRETPGAQRFALSEFVELPNLPASVVPEPIGSAGVLVGFTAFLIRRRTRRGEIG